MHSHAGHSPALRIYLCLNAAALIAAAALMIAVARGGTLSTFRLILAAGTFLAAALAAATAIFLQLRPRTDLALHQAIFDTRLTKRLVPLFGICFSIFWSLTWLPPAYTGDLYYYFIGFYPLILCGTLASGSGLVLLLLRGSGASGKLWTLYWNEHRAVLQATLISLGGFAALALLTRWLKVLETSEPYWRGAGVPILASQVFLTAIIAIAALKLESRLAVKNAPLDRILFVLIWVVAAVLWAARPVPASFWVTDPRPPNFEYYPFSDSLVYDLGSQFALIGQGINNHVFFDRALYMSFLVYLHTLLGQNYQQLMAGQAALFAVFPALLYLIGMKLHSRNAGIILAALTILRGLNSLTATPWIHSATFKHMLTEFPTALGLAAFILLILKWLESPRGKRHHLIWASGVLGLTSLLRPHVLLLLPPLLLLAIWMERPAWKARLTVSGFVCLAFVAAVLPWMLSSADAASPITFYGRRIHDVLVQRYPGFAPRPAATLPPPQATAAPSVGTPPAPPPAALVPPPANPLIPFPLAHYLHNLVVTGLMFPDSPQFLPVVATVRDGEDFWQLRWPGDMSPTAVVMLLLNLAILAFGLGAAFQHLRWRGLLPLAVFLIYHLANGLARTSGGRYLVPVDWILVAYYALGLAEALQLCRLLTDAERGAALVATASPTPARLNTALKQAKRDSGRRDHARPAPPEWRGDRSSRSVWISFVFIALIGGLVPLAGYLYPERYPTAGSPSLLDRMGPYWQSLNLSRASAEAFLGQPNAVLLDGRALYPRFYRRGIGELFSYDPFLPADYPRMVFVLVGPDGAAFSVLPKALPAVFPDASDVIVLGCRSSSVQQGVGYVNALALILPAQGASYARSPSAPLTCPLPVPVCDNNGNCR